MTVERSSRVQARSISLGVTRSNYILQCARKLRFNGNLRQTSVQASVKKTSRKIIILTEVAVQTLSSITCHQYPKVRRVTARLRMNVPKKCSDTFEKKLFSLIYYFLPVKRCNKHFFPDTHYSC